MILPVGSRGQRGASVLAALILIAILGAIFVILQYARSVGDLAYQPSALTAAAAPSSLQTPGLQGCKRTITEGGTSKIVSVSGSTVNTKTDTCPCDQSKNVNAAKDLIEQCLPGCVYTITVNPTTGATVSNTTGNSVPTQSYGTVITKSPQDSGTGAATQYCVPGQSTKGSQYPSTQAAEHAQGITSSGSNTPAVPGQGGSATGNDQLNSDLNGHGDGPSTSPCTTDAGVPGTWSSDGTCNSSASTQTSSPAAFQGPCPAGETQTSTGCTPLVTDTNPASKCQSAACVDLNSGDYGNTFQGPCPSGQVQTSTGCSQPAATNNPASGCQGAACVDGNTNNYGGSSDTFQGPCPQGQTQTSTGCSASSATGGGGAGGGTGGGGTGGSGGGGTGSGGSGGSGSGSGLGSLGSGATSFLTGVLQGMTRAMAQNQANQAAQQAYDQQQAANSPYGTGSDGNSCPQPQRSPPHHRVRPDHGLSSINPTDVRRRGRARLRAPLRVSNTPTDRASIRQAHVRSMANRELTILRVRVRSLRQRPRQRSRASRRR